MSRWSAFLRCHNYKRKLFTVPGRDVSTSAQFPATVNDWEGFMMTFARRNEIFWTFRRENLLHDGVIFESAKKKPLMEKLRDKFIFCPVDTATRIRSTETQDVKQKQIG